LPEDRQRFHAILSAMKLNLAGRVDSVVGMKVVAEIDPGHRRPLSDLFGGLFRTMSARTGSAVD
jgi:hypothetical protein